MASVACLRTQLGAFDWARWVPRLGPPLLSAVVVAAILTRYSLPVIAARLGEGHALPLVGWAAALSIGYLALAALADTLVLRRLTAGPVTFADVARGKAAAAVLNVLGYVAASGGYGVWIARRTGVGAARASGLVLYFMASDLAAVGLVASAVGPVARVDVPVALRLTAAALAALPVLAIVVGPRLGLRAPLLASWTAVPRSVGLLQLAVRTLNVTVAALVTTLAARAFGLSVPVETLAAYMPFLLLVASLPISFAGIGAAQGAWLLFLLPFEEGPRILAFQLAWSAIFGAAMVLRGLPFLRRALAQIA